MLIGVIDGPVDAMWIESMNSVMDDNKILTLINGDRIPLTSSMSLLFEVEDLRVASPATVSRAGMIFLDQSEMGFKPFLESWLERLFGTQPEVQKLHQNLLGKYVSKILEYKASSCVEPVPISDFNAILSFTQLYEALHTKENGLDASADIQAYSQMAERWFLFALTWSITAAVDETGRKKLDIYLRDLEAQFPPSRTIYDYFCDPQKKDFEQWESGLTTWRPRKGDSFFKMIVPTSDSLRNSFIFRTIVSSKHNLLVVGNTGVGKTVQVMGLMTNLPAKNSKLVINFSATTKSSALQDIVESVMEKRSKDKLGPLGGKELLIFVRDSANSSQTEIVEYLSNLHMFWGARVRLGGLSVANRSTTSICRRKPQPSLRSNHPSSCCGSGWTMAAGTTALNVPGNTF